MVLLNLSERAQKRTMLSAKKQINKSEAGKQNPKTCQEKERSPAAEGDEEQADLKMLRVQQNTQDRHEHGEMEVEKRGDKCPPALYLKETAKNKRQQTNG